MLGPVLVESLQFSSSTAISKPQVVRGLHLHLHRQLLPARANSPMQLSSLPRDCPCSSFQGFALRFPQGRTAAMTEPPLSRSAAPSR